MTYYADWMADYSELLFRVEQGFDPSEVALVSFGTLTFTKSIIRRIRTGGFKTRILRMPLAESDGKLSYPDAIRAFEVAMKSSYFAKIRGHTHP